MPTVIDVRAVSSAPARDPNPVAPIPQPVDHPVLKAVRVALGRAPDELRIPPPPPVIDEPLVRLVYSDLGLAELFARTAAANHMQVQAVYVDELNAKLIELLDALGAKKIGLAKSALLEKIEVPKALSAGGFDATPWPELSMEQVYALDCGITDVTWAVAETGSLVIAPSASQGRLLSLAPAVHIAIVEPKNLLPDLVDLLEKIPGDAPAVHIISGPSKTADIEGVLVEGVHGPKQVHVFVLQ